MKTNPGDVAAQARDTAGLVQPEIRTCPACGTQFPASGDSGLCPVCILREAAGEESAATGIPSSVSELAAASAEETDEASHARRFEHYKVMSDETGKPIELGRGAMGITYKGFDVDLRCPVTLKVISERTVPSYATIEDTQLLVERENSLPRGVLARFSTTRWSGVFLARIADGGRLGL